MFEVSVFLACRTATPEAPHGPGALAGMPYTLEGVSYVFRVHDPAAEPPFRVEPLCLYVRLQRSRYSRTGGLGSLRRRLDLRVFSHDQDPPRQVEYPAGAAPGGVSLLAEAHFPAGVPVVSIPMDIRDLSLPRRGLVEFRLYARRGRSSNPTRWRRLASHYIVLE